MAFVAGMYTFLSIGWEKSVQVADTVYLQTGKYCLLAKGIRS